jgi:hypothetical protein
MSDCNQVEITDDAFANLTNLTNLNMSGCRQVGITDIAFANLGNLTTLHLYNTNIDIRNTNLLIINPYIDMHQ